MKTIIAATDFSPVSLHAVEYVTNLAMAIQAKLLLVHIIELPVTEAPISGEYYDAMMNDARHQLFALQDKRTEYP